jgi:HD-GYP domain-containing protein (c-di-GMP phosphodiesterase class II)
MFSILDILKKHREEKGKALSAAPVAQPSAPVIREGDSICSPAAFFTEDLHESVSVFSAVNKEIVAENLRQMLLVYGEAVAVARKVYSARGAVMAVIKDELDPLLSRIATMIVNGNREAVRVFFSDYPDGREYLYYHAVNVCLLSIEFGLVLAYEPAVLHELAKAAFLHDIGMVSLSEYMMKPAKLTGDDSDKIRQHPAMGVDALTRISREFSHSIVDTIAQEHERCDGTGYPKGLKADAICEYARIVAVADVYEALVHSRPYRPAFTPSEAVNTILKVKAAFDSRVIKALIERVGIFPEGTKVRLNTREIALVLKVDPQSPLRPLVSVFIDAQGNELKICKEINLCKNYLIHIEENLAK